MVVTMRLMINYEDKKIDLTDLNLLIKKIDDGTYSTTRLRRAINKEIGLCYDKPTKLKRLKNKLNKLIKLLDKRIEGKEW